MSRKRKAFWSSAVSLLLCVSMLLGTTYAWFTDSVTSTANNITTGTLKVGLYHTNAALTTETKVTNQTKDLFQVELWEPGVAAYENFTIKNEGSLWLKYQLGLNALDVNYALTSGDAQYGLSQALVAGVVPGGIQDSNNDGIITRDEAVAQVAQWKKLNEVLEAGALAPQGKTDAVNGQLVSDSTGYGVVIWWQPTGSDNNWNVNNGRVTSDGNPLAVDLGVTLAATQYSREEDSFGADYDSTAQFPELNLPVSVTVAVPNENGATTQEVTLTGRDVAATVPAGVQLADGAQELTLSVTPMAGTGSNITTGETEDMVSLDVHMAGVSAANDKPIIVNLGPVMPKYLNMGNYRLYHVEGGATNPMTKVDALAEVDEHNEFYYDLNTGNLTVAMATFSELALVADTENAWEGNFDYSWYLAKSNEYTIANADQLAAFGAIVGGMNGQTQDSFDGKTVKLIADVNLGDAEEKNNSDLIFYPIGYYNSTGSYEKTPGGSVSSSVSSFEGDFDGQGHTIANFYQNTWEMFGDYNDGYSGTPNHYKDAMGLFGYVLNGTVKNLTVDNFASDGEFTPTGVIAAYADGNTTFENIAITNCNPRVYNTGNGGIIGIAGDTNAANDDHITLKNITVDNSNKISALWGSYDVACGGLVGMYRGNVDGSGNATGDTISFENCHVSATIDVYNDVCGNYQYYAYRYAGMIIGSVRHNTKNAEGKTIPNMAGISATGCTVNYGDWNDYYYCEFEKNGHPSYSGPTDYKFSRIDKSEVIFDANGNVTGCTHSHSEVEDNRAIYLPFHQLFTGYSWGVSSIGLQKYGGIITDDQVAEGDQEESVEKFETKFTGDFLYRVGNQNTVSLGSLFAAKDGVNINSSGVVATIDKVEENSNVGGTHTANTTDWTKGTIQFSGTGVVKVTIQDYNFCTPTVLYLEVVDAVNATKYSELKSTNSVMLNDITMPSNGKYSLYDYQTLYGNGFTFDVVAGRDDDTAGGYVGGNGTVWVRNSTLDNVKIVGEVYTQYGGTVTSKYNFPTVLVLGDSTIANSYISNGAAAVRVGSGCNLEIINSTLEGGNFANLDIRGGTITLKDVTTINQSDAAGASISNDKGVVGLGIVVYTGSTVRINVDGLTQYNCISKNTKFSGDALTLKNIIFGTDYTKFQFQHNDVTWVNTGIISMVEEVKEDNISQIAGYEGQDASIPGGYGGYVYAPVFGAVSNPPSQYEATAQYQIAPKASFDYTTKNNVPQTSGSNDYCYYDEASGRYLISFDEGEAFDWDAGILTVTKGGSELPYDVSVTGPATISGNKITFDTAGDYTVTYSYNDPVNYRLNGGTVETYSCSYKRTVAITVYEVADTSAKTAFTFGNNGGRAETANNLTYVMPDVNATEDSHTAGIGVTTVGGVNVYYPIVSMHKSGTSTWYNYFSVFEAVTITDLNGTVHSKSTTELPSGLAVVGGFILDAAGNISTKESENGTKIFNYATGKEIKCANYSTYGLCYYPDSQFSSTGTSDRAEQTIVVKYRYTDSNGTPYYYYVGYWCEEHKKSSICVTPDTLITLADGTQKRIDEVTYADQFLVWDFSKGEYTVAPASIVMNHGCNTYDVVTLNFADGTVVKTINGHGFYAAADNKFVIISKANAAEHVGSDFVKQDGAVTELVSYSIATEQTESWSVLTAEHYNCILEGMLTITPAEVEGSPDYLMPFAVGEDMKYDEAAMQSDIEQYGLYTYEEFADYMTEEQFDALGLATFKIAVGKGYITYEDILYLISIHLG